MNRPNSSMRCPECEGRDECPNRVFLPRYEMPVYMEGGKLCFVAGIGKIVKKGDELPLKMQASDNFNTVKPEYGSVWIIN